MRENDDFIFMQRCLELAVKAEGMTFPNPLVGSVIVHNGEIIGEGFHLKSGLPHAEVNAINSVKLPEKLKDSTLYVNLEPCSNFGKTPPCTDLIISKSIKRIVVGTLDTSEKESGKGIGKLRNAGCEVIVGVMEKECRRLNRRFFTYNELRRPYITLKWAQSADGFLDILRSEQRSGTPNWISGKPERILVHKWRAAEQAILVGGATVRTDNPQLTVREWKGEDPLKVILSGSGNLGRQSAINTAKKPAILFTGNMNSDLDNAVKVKLTDDMPASAQIIRYLYEKGIQSLFIEGGASVFNHFISEGLWDEARVFTGKSYFRKGVKAPVISGKMISSSDFKGSHLEIYLNVGSPANLKM